MGEVLPLPHRGDVFLDPRGEGRSLRVSGHRDAATVVLSIWRQGECRATFRLSGGEVDEFVRALLSAAPPAAPSLDLPAVAGEPAAASVLQVQISGNVVVELNPKDPAATTGDVLSSLTEPVAAAPEPASADAPERPDTAGDDPADRKPGPGPDPVD